VTVYQVTAQIHLLRSSHYFTEDLKRETAIVKANDGRLLAVTKGAA
jgi:Ca2+-transporting ATPase